MAVFTIKDRSSNNQAIVDEEGYLYVRPAGGGGLSNVNIFDSSGNPLSSTGTALNTYVVNPGGSSAWANFGQSTPKQVSVGPTTTPLLSANSLRVFARISNNSAQTIYIQYGNPAVWQQGQVIPPNASYVINSQELFTGQINAITQTGSVNIDVIEGVV